jgi:putative ABC transport system ATP-binding protein
MLIASNLSHSFDYPLFDGVNIELLPAQSSAIVGVSGSGKSTLLHILSTFLSPNSGTVHMGGQNLYSLDENELLNIRRNQIGIIFQSHYLFRGFSASENIKVAELLSKERMNEKLANRFGIAEQLKQQSSTLSGGQQQRLSIVRVLSKRPKIIFADEPTGNLDKSTAKDVMNSIFEYIKQNSASLLCVTHDEEFAHQCDNVFRLHDGSLNRIK